MKIIDKIKIFLSQIYAIISSILFFGNMIYCIENQITTLDNLMFILGINWLFSSILLACIYDEYKLL